MLLFSSPVALVAASAVTLSAFALLLAAAPAAHAQTVFINFDTDANGNPLTAPSSFGNAAPLTTAYSSLGVTFSGPAPEQGGAILNDASFNPKARSGSNFLAFNRNSDAGYAQDPETLSFSSNVSSVSIYAAGAGGAPGVSNAFTIQAFDVSNNAIASSSSTNVAGSYTLLNVVGTGIRSVRLTSTAGSDAFVYDDLTFVQSNAAGAAPEPSTLPLLGMGIISGIGTLGMARRRKAAKQSKQAV